MTFSWGLTGFGGGYLLGIEEKTVENFKKNAGITEKSFFIKSNCFAWLNCRKANRQGT
jgi:hypothetical protein